MESVATAPGATGVANRLHCPGRGSHRGRHLDGVWAGGHGWAVDGDAPGVGQVQAPMEAGPATFQAVAERDTY